MNIAINGFGRIGRLLTRSLQNEPNLNLVHINSGAHVNTACHLLKYDSVHGNHTFDVKGCVDESTSRSYFEFGDKMVNYTQERDITKLRWDNVDLVVDCTGKYTNKESAFKHINSGAKKVLISAPGDNVHYTAVYGVNHQNLQDTDLIVSSGSCTTNCLAPIAEILDENVGIEKGFITTIHSYTGDQNLVDNSHKDLYRSRAAACSIIPTKTGAAKAISNVLPNLEGKLNGTALRVPTPNVSCVDFTFVSKKDCTEDEVNELIRNSIDDKYSQVYSYTDEPIVSIDVNSSNYAGVVHLQETKVVDKNFVRVLVWYDNEYGFTQQLIRLCNHMRTL
jgi:glyceraldehyde 3-phosphate dehydrogenase